MTKRERYSAHELADGTFLIVEQPDPAHTYEDLPQDPVVVFTVPHIAGSTGGRNPYTKARAEKLVEAMNTCDGLKNPGELRAQRDELLKTVERMLGNAQIFKRQFANPMASLEFIINDGLAAIDRVEGRRK
jgi:hypothetical protein